jgi:hypothetical protein
MPPSLRGVNDCHVKGKERRGHPTTTSRTRGQQPPRLPVRRQPLARQPEPAAVRFSLICARGETLVPTRHGDEIAAGETGRGHLRASHADREQVIGTLKAAFAEDMLAKDKFDARVGLAFVSRTYASWPMFYVLPVSRWHGSLDPATTDPRPAARWWRQRSGNWFGNWTYVLSAADVRDRMPMDKANPVIRYSTLSRPVALARTNCQKLCTTLCRGSGFGGKCGSADQTVR